MNKLESEFREFLEMLPRKSEFSVIFYPKDKIVRFKFGVNENIQATLKCMQTDYEKFIKSKEVNLYFTGLFRKEMIKGNINMSEILYDAKPVNQSLESFFKVSSNSRYENTIGLHGGNMVIEKQKNKLYLLFSDLNKTNSISGKYFLNETYKYINFNKFISKELHLKIAE